MAMPHKNDEPNKNNLNHLLDKLEEEFRWCAQNTNDVSDFELEQLKDAVDMLEGTCKNIGGQLYSDFQKFRKEFDYLADHPKEISAWDFQKFDEMIQTLFRDLK